MGKAKRILVAVHPAFRPDRGRKRPGTERDVWLALRRLGHHVQVEGVEEDLPAFEQRLAKFNPHLVFNLMEEFRGEAVFDFHVISRLEALGIPFTGCNPRGLILSRNKYLTGLVAAGLGVSTPKSWLAAELPSSLAFPLFVKLNREHASLGIRESNRVQTSAQLRATCRRLREDFASEILVQEFISGHDVSVAVWGNKRCVSFAPRRLSLGGAERVSTARVKFSVVEQRRRSVRSLRFHDANLEGILRHQARRLFRHLDMSGYARFDFRVREDGAAFLIDVNANPNLAKDEDFAVSSGLQYLDVIENILQLGLKYRPNV